MSSGVTSSIKFLTDEPRNRIGGDAGDVELRLAFGLGDARGRERRFEDVRLYSRLLGKGLRNDRPPSLRAKSGVGGDNDLRIFLRQSRKGSQRWQCSQPPKYSLVRPPVYIQCNSDDSKR